MSAYGIRKFLRGAGAVTVVVAMSFSGLLAVGVTAASASPGDITTIAGGGADGLGLNNSGPNAVARFGDHLYVGEYNGYIIDREISTGRQVLFAGDPLAGNGFSGDAGPATSAQLGEIAALAADSVGNLYVSDYTDCRVRRIDHTTHVIDTVAGDGTCGNPGDGVAATSSHLHAPFASLAVDANDDLFISQYEAISKIDHNSGIISTVAGQYGNDGYADGAPETAQFSGGADSLAIDSDGKLYVADRNSNAIRCIGCDLVHPTWVTTIAGGGNTGGIESATGPHTVAVGPGYYGSTGGVDVSEARFDLRSYGTAIAVSPTHEIYFGDSVNFRLRKISADHATVTDVMGTGVDDDIVVAGDATAADVSQVRALAFTADGGFYLASQATPQDANVKIRYVDAAAPPQVHNANSSGLTGDGGAAVNAFVGMPIDLLRVGNSLYVAEMAYRVRKIDLTTGVITTFAGTGEQGSTGDGGPATSATLQQMMALGYDGTSIYLMGMGAIRKVDMNTHVITSVGGTGICYFPAGMVGSDIQDAAYPTCGDGGPASAGKYSFVSGMVATSDRKIYFSDTTLNAIRCIGCDLAHPTWVTTIAGATDRSIGWVPDGTAAAGSPITIPLRVVLSPPRADDGGKRHIVFSQVDGEVREIWGDGTLRTIAGVHQDVTNPAPSGGDGGLATAAHLAMATALRFDAAGNLYIGEFGTTPWGAPWGSGSGNPSTYHPRIRKVDASTGIISTFAGTGAFGYSGDGGPATNARLSVPTAISPDGGTHLFVADLLNNHIRRIEGPKPNLSVSLSTDGALTAGQRGVVHVSVANAATDPDAYLTGPVSARVTLPAGLSYASASVVTAFGVRKPQDDVASWTCEGASQVVTCSTPDNIPPQAASTFDITVQVDPNAFGTVTVNALGSSDSDVSNPDAKIAVLGISVRRSATPAPSDGHTKSVTESDTGYVLAGADGGTFAFGPASFPGAADVAGNRIVAAASADAHGSWLTSADGSVFTTGDTQFYGSLGTTKLNSPIAGIAAHGSDGYWLVGADGGVFAEGSATFHGSLGAMKLNSPIVGMTATPSGNGYWLVAKDGGVFAEGDAQFYGSHGATKLNSPIVSMRATSTGMGYWLVAADGGVFAYGDAAFAGSHATTTLNSPIVAMVPTHWGTGYWLVAKDGGVFAYGTATFDGSMAGSKLKGPIVSAW